MSDNKNIFDLNNIVANFDNQAVLTPELINDRRKRLLELELSLGTIPGSYEMEEFNKDKIKHHFGTGVYGRELFIPAGNVIVSKIHKGKTLNVIAKGKITVICPHKGLNTYIGPFCFVSEPFTKRVVIAHEDTLWITSHENQNNSQDLNEIEKNIIAENFNDSILETKGGKL